MPPEEKKCRTSCFTCWYVHENKKWQDNVFANIIEEVCRYFPQCMQENVEEIFLIKELQKHILVYTTLKLFLPTFLPFNMSDGISGIVILSCNSYKWIHIFPGVVLQCYSTFRGRNPAQTQHLPTNQMIDCRTSHTENIFWENNIYSHFSMKICGAGGIVGGGAGQVQLSRDVIVYNNRKRLSCYKIFSK